MRVVGALLAAVLLVGGCGSSETSTPDAARSTAAEQSESSLEDAQRYIQGLFDELDVAYEPFYEEFGEDDPDLATLQAEAANVSQAEHRFADGVDTYDWPSQVEDSTVDAVVADWTAHAEGWARVAEAESVGEMEGLLRATDAAGDPSVTDDLWTQLGLELSQDEDERVRGDDAVTP